MRHATAMLLLGTLLWTGVARAQPDCVEAPPPRVRVNPNNGLPALGAMVLAAGTALGLLSAFVGGAGVVLALERTATTAERNVVLAGTAFAASALTAFTLVTLVAGGSIWFFAWLPPPTDTRVRCPPPSTQGPT